MNAKEWLAKNGVNAHGHLCEDHDLGETCSKCCGCDVCKILRDSILVTQQIVDEVLESPDMTHEIDEVIREMGLAFAEGVDSDETDALYERFGLTPEDLVRPTGSVEEQASYLYAVGLLKTAMDLNEVLTALNLMASDPVLSGVARSMVLDEVNTQNMFVILRDLMIYVARNEFQKGMIDAEDCNLDHVLGQAGLMSLQLRTAALLASDMMRSEVMDVVRRAMEESGAPRGNPSPFGGRSGPVEA